LPNCSNGKKWLELLKCVAKCCSAGSETVKLDLDVYTPSHMLDKTFLGFECAKKYANYI
jgi:hypothetical protein